MISFLGFVHLYTSVIIIWTQAWHSSPRCTSPNENCNSQGWDETGICCYHYRCVWACEP